jgi:hypothetical protein
VVTENTRSPSTAAATQARSRRTGR